jgi:hypothetical protein
VDDAPIEITVSLLTPFVAYLAAERLGVSGVLAVVTAGLYLGRRMPELLTFKTRLQGGPVWEMVEFLLNGFVFILIGLQLPEVLHALSGHDIPIPPARLVCAAHQPGGDCHPHPLGFSGDVSAAPDLQKTLPPRSPSEVAARHHHRVDGHARGGFARRRAGDAAHAGQDGSPFPGRDLILFLTFIVILATLVLQGLSLPLLIRWLGIKDDGSMEKEEREARLKANQAALARLNEIAEHEPAKADALQRLRVEYEDHIRQVEGAEPESAGTPLRLFSSEYERLSHEALQGRAQDHPETSQRGRHQR